MDRRSLLENMLVERERWDALLSQLHPDWMTEPLAPGGMSVKQIVAHITWYERECAQMLCNHTVADSELWRLPQDERNARIIDECHRCSVTEVRNRSQRAFEELLAAVSGLTEDDLHDVSRYRNWPHDWVPWQVIASDSYEHYAQHMAAVRAWLQRQREKL